MSNNLRVLLMKSFKIFSNSQELVIKAKWFSSFKRFFKGIMDTTFFIKSNDKIIYGVGVHQLLHPQIVRTQLSCFP